MPASERCGQGAAQGCGEWRAAGQVELNAGLEQLHEKESQGEAVRGSDCDARMGAVNVYH